MKISGNIHGANDLDLKLKRNVLWKAIEAVVTITASTIQLSCVARSYSPEVVGQYQLILAWLFFVAALSCSGGIAMVSTRELSISGENRRNEIFSSAIALQTSIIFLLGIVCGATFYSLPYFRAFALPLSLGSGAVFGAMILQVSQTLLVSKEQIGRVVIASIFGHLLATVLIVIAAYHGLSTSFLITAWAAFGVINGLALFHFSGASQAISLHFIHCDVMKKLGVEILPVLIMVLATHLYVRIDVIMLDYFTNKEVVAQYSAGYLFLDQLMILSNFMMSALFPNFARSCEARGRDYQVLYRGILRLFLKYLVPIALAIAIFSPFLLDSIYGSEYTIGWPSLSVLTLAALFAWLNGPSGTIFISLRKQHVYIWATLLSLVVNIVGNLILIPMIGAIGAAVSTVLTEAAICAFCLYWIYRETGYLPWFRPQSEVSERSANISAM